VRLAKGYLVRPCRASSVEAMWALQTPAHGNHGSWVTMYNFCRNLINCYNSLAQGYERPGSFIISGYYWVLGWLGMIKLWLIITETQDGLFTKVVTQGLIKCDQLKVLTAVNRVKPLSLITPLLYLLSMVRLHLFYSTFIGKSRMGNRC